MGEVDFRHALRLRTARTQPGSGRDRWASISPILKGPVPGGWGSARAMQLEMVPIFLVGVLATLGGDRHTISY